MITIDIPPPPATRPPPGARAVAAASALTSPVALASALLGYSIDRYKPCAGIPNAATVAVTTGRVSLSPCTALWSMKIKKNIFATQ